MPWIPQSVLDHLLAIANDARPRREHLHMSSGAVGEGQTRPNRPMRYEDFVAATSGPVERELLRSAGFNPPEPTPPAVVIELPEPIQRASVAYSYGNPQQITANEEYARRALLRGDDPLDIVKALQDGEEL